MTDTEPGSELNARMASEVMGRELQLRGLGWFCIDHGYWEPVAQYSSDIAAAWQVMERLREGGFRPILTSDWGNQWSCSIYRRKGWICQSKWCDTAAHAICLAALEAVKHD